MIRSIIRDVSHVFIYCYCCLSGALSFSLACCDEYALELGGLIVAPKLSFSYRDGFGELVAEAKEVNPILASLLIPLL